MGLDSLDFSSGGIEKQEITQQQPACLARARNSTIRAFIGLLYNLTFVMSVMALLRNSCVVAWHGIYNNSPNLVIPSPKFYSIQIHFPYSSNHSPSLE